MSNERTQAITGLTPPEVGEARIRETWPSVARFPALASLGRMLTGTIILAPLAWLVMSLAYFGKLLPFVARRYSLTNRRVMIRHGLSGKPGAEVPLANIDEVRVETDANSDFFRAANLHILVNGQAALTLTGVPEAEGFRQAILNACSAWTGRKRGPFIAASEK
jgi:hypothetical protein